MKKKTIQDIDLKGKKVIVRVDFNVPQDDAGTITDDRRIQAALPTIQYLLDQECAVILMSHMGRPQGMVKESLRLNAVAKRLAEIYGNDCVSKADDCVGPEVAAAARDLSLGKILLLENLRFHSEEEDNNPDFAKQLAGLADIYVDDAFGTAHRAHASTEGIASFLPAVSGLLMAKEIEFLTKAVSEPDRPFVAIIGGAKVSDKIKVIEHLISKVDVILIGGAMAYTFLKEQGKDVGNSLVEGVIEDKKGRKIDCPALARQAMRLAKEKKVCLLLPVDHQQAKAKKVNDAAGVSKLVWEQASDTDDNTIASGCAGVDIGPKTRALYAAEIEKAKMVVWNGPMGIFEVKPFDEGTMAIAKACAACTAHGGLTIVGGGDSVAAIETLGYADRVSHISTGGGASLELLEGKTLPGVAALNACCP